MRGRVATVMSVCLLLFAIVAGGCAGPGGQSGSSDLAARYDGGEIPESAVTEYTEQFRSDNGYEDDTAWAEYLYGEGLTAKTWRERAIGSLIEDELIARKAKELGIVADEVRVSTQVSSDKALAGISDDDDEAWREYLASRGMTEEEYRSVIEKASIEQQVLSQEVTLDPVEDADVFDEYIQAELVPRVVRRYKVLCFDSEERAQAAIDDMAGLFGDELVARFDSWLERDDSDMTTLDGGGDMGWDIASNLGDAQYELNSEMVPAGALSQTPHDIDGVYYVFLCTDRFAFETSTTYSTLPDDDLRSYVASVATYDNWSQLTSDYIAHLRDAANVQVRVMPDNLPYNVDDMIVKEPE